ncbi:hypothetical protein [Natronomonas sp. EA1]|uniref:hypothetical protein n=1 Tax=Natronomonas sp. EA1 TaxID=3421655 RepID=UPI003EB8E626
MAIVGEDVDDRLPDVAALYERAGHPLGRDQEELSRRLAAADSAYGFLRQDTEALVGFVRLVVDDGVLHACDPVVDESHPVDPRESLVATLEFGLLGQFDADAVRLYSADAARYERHSAGSRVVEFVADEPPV